MRRYASALVFITVFFAFLSLAPRAVSALEPPKKKLTVYTAMTATTPQIPLWAAANGHGRAEKNGWNGGYALKTEYWKNLDDLRGVILAGKGDIWVGHLETLLQAARRGAPVTLIAVTGWKKFYFVSTKPLPVAGDGATPVAVLAALLAQSGKALAAAPQGSPALGILNAIERRGGPAFRVETMPPQQLMLAMLRGAYEAALIPEPLVSTLLAKKPDLHVAASLEDEYARRFGGPARLPWAGIAVHTRLAKEDPRFVQELVARMQSAAARLADPQASDPKTGDFLPQAVRDAVGADVLAASLSRDIICVMPAAAVKDEVHAFLDTITPPGPEARGAAFSLPAGFIFDPAPAAGSER